MELDVDALRRTLVDVADAMDDWIDSDDIWLARIAITHQLRFAEHTDTERLFRFAARRGDDPEFFIRKAVGWALRQYAKSDPTAVRRFVDEHRHVLSPLALREATRHLTDLTDADASGSSADRLCGSVASHW